jgi:hypothetical protein
LRAEPKTPHAQSHRALWRFVEDQLDRLDFAGKTVIDIGCWDGYWSFYRERRQAHRVLATDDTSQNWAGEAGFRLAHELLESSVESDLQRSVYDLHAIGDTFDIILCLGIYYHLFDPDALRDLIDWAPIERNWPSSVFRQGRTGVAASGAVQGHLACDVVRSVGREACRGAGRQSVVSSLYLRLLDKQSAHDVRPVP